MFATYMQKPWIEVCPYDIGSGGLQNSADCFRTGSPLAAAPMVTRLSSIPTNLQLRWVLAADFIHDLYELERKTVAKLSDPLRVLKPLPGWIQGFS